MKFYRVIQKVFDKYQFLMMMFYMNKVIGLDFGGGGDGVLVLFLGSLRLKVILE